MLAAVDSAKPPSYDAYMSANGFAPTPTRATLAALALCVAACTANGLPRYGTAPPPGATCSIVSESCGDGAGQCCGGMCSNQTCEQVQMDPSVSCSDDPSNCSTACSGECSAGSCLAMGSTCGRNTECCDSLCAPLPGVQGVMQCTCVGSGAACTADAQCCNGGACVSGHCSASSCYAVAATCQNDGQCCDGLTCSPGDSLGRGKVCECHGPGQTLRQQ